MSRTKDGTTIITSSWDNQVSSFLIPEHLLEPRHHALTLRSHKTLQLATPTNVIASAPYYDIRCSNTDHLLVACQDHPLQLYQTGLPPRLAQEHEDNCSTPEDGNRRTAPIGSYHFTSPTTEAYYPIHSLIWPYPGTHFLVGTRDLIAQFDVTRNGDGPSSQIPTIPSRRHIRKGNGVGMRGTVSALSAQTNADDAPTGLIAAGTWTRWVGLYDIARSGECTATWSIAEAAKGVTYAQPPTDSSHSHDPTEPTFASGTTRPLQGIGGAGIIQTTWSPCGRYLLLNERQSTGMLVYDVRGTNKVLGFLAGRNARTHQRMSCDVFRGLDSVGGFEVWGGTLNGTVKVWEGVGNTEGCLWPSWGFSAADGGADDGRAREHVVAPALGSVALHFSGSVVATCAGSRVVPDEDAPLRSGRMEESSLKLWRIGASGDSNEIEPAIDPDGVTTMGEADEIEKHRQRSLSALITEDSSKPELTDIEQHRNRVLAALETADSGESQLTDLGQHRQRVLSETADSGESESMDLEKHRQKVLSALGIAETADPEFAEPEPEPMD